MPIPNVNLTVLDGALGLVPASTDTLHVKVGYSTLGTANTLYSFTDIASVKATLGAGPLAEAVAFALQSGVGQVYAMPAAASTAGSSGTVTKVGTGTGTIAFGTPNDAYDIRVKIVTGGAVATATYQLSLDGGDTYGPTTTTAASVNISPTGATMTFAGTFVAGDVYSIACTAPACTSSDLSAAFAALLADARTWGFVHVVGEAASAAAAVTLASAIDAQMTTAEAGYRYAFALVELPYDTDSNLLSATASFASTRVGLVAGHCEIASALRGTFDRRSAAWPIAARIAKNAISQDAARFRDGSLPGVASLYRDEQKTPGLDDGRLCTLRTFIGQSGYYVTNARLATNSTSDFKYVVTRRVVDRACAVTRGGLLAYLNDSVRVNKTTGRILETDARAIEAAITAQLKAALVDEGHASDVQFVLDRTGNILSTNNLKGDVRVTPLGYARSISVSVGLFNPALLPVAA